MLALHALFLSLKFAAFRHKVADKKQPLPILATLTSAQTTAALVALALLKLPRLPTPVFVFLSIAGVSGRGSGCLITGMG